MALKALSLQAIWKMEEKLELIAFLTGITGIWLTMRQNVWCFPVGLINVSLSMVIFYEQHLYADAIQQIMYITLLIYGWYNWKRKGTMNVRLGVSRLSLKEIAGYCLLILLSTLLLGGLLITLTAAIFPWADSLATSTAFVAQYLVARKKLENWLLWMGVNLVYIAIYYHKDLHLYVILFSVYLILSFFGLYQWNKELKAQLASPNP
ncbi:MAG: nicotinamide mononucleotide transporter [Bacteroidetes bacterium]|nr:nicotinamide mononucleotide transporter [Bacteroidota bacterium]